MNTVFQEPNSIFSQKRNRKSQSRRRPRSKSKLQNKSNHHSKTQKAATKIQSFFKRTETPRKIAFLKAVCSDAGECVMFGKETKNIKRVFHDFTLHHTDSLQIRRMGAVSNNGFVVELPFTRSGYTAYGVLKSSASADADNLLYEAFVGIFINKITAYYPCFIETYASYVYENEMIYNHLKEGSSVKKDDLVKGLTENKPLSYTTLWKDSLLKKSCTDPQKFAVLLQHIKGATSIHDQMMSLKGDSDFFTVHLIAYLFQVYCPLHKMEDHFTHYDLHTENVLIYTPSVCSHTHGISYGSSDKYIRMMYHYHDGTTLEFNTFGIAKIIDYGRCYMNDTQTKITSKDFYNKLCEVDKDCGWESGYSSFEEEDPYGSFHYICSQKHNQSHDLRLINMIWKITGKYSGENSAPLRTIMAKTVYDDEYALKESGQDDGFGTPEVRGESYLRVGDPIKNVRDMHNALHNLIQNEPYFKLENDRIFKDKTKIGEMHMWVDFSKKMEYIPTLA